MIIKKLVRLIFMLQFTVSAVKIEVRVQTDA